MRRDDQGRRLCTSHRSDGEKCRAPAVKGATVCVNHGGAKGTPGRAAADRILLTELVGPALIRLQELIEDPDTPKPVLLGAIKDTLDRTGYKPPHRAEWDVIPPIEVVDGWLEQLNAEDEQGDDG